MTDIKALTRLDEQDVLRALRRHFVIPDGHVYLDGNSLGMLPKGVVERANQVVSTQWGGDLITSWNKHGWIDLSQSVGDRIGRLVGAKSGQVVCTDSISVNLFKVLSAAKSLSPERRVILSTHDNFPTDLYMVQGLSQLLGSAEIELVLVDEAALWEQVNESTLAILVSHVNFRTGALLDMPELTQRAHEMGALTIWDLAHSAGALDVQLDQCKVDFAVGCTYKYLNGGPGAPAFLYCNQRHLDTVRQPLTGWMGHASPFEFTPNYQSDKSIKQFLTGTPPIVSMACVDAALDVFDSVSMSDVRAKSVALSEQFEALLAERNLLDHLSPIHSNNTNKRGSQLAYASEDAYGLCQALIERKIIPDFRAPNIIRFGFTPLYTRFEDVWLAVTAIEEVITSGEHRDPRWNTKLAVT